MSGTNQGISKVDCMGPLDRSLRTPSLFRRLVRALVSAPVARFAVRNVVRRARRAIVLCHALMSERGEVSGARLAKEAITAFQALDEPAIYIFFRLLIKEFSPNAVRVARIASTYGEEPSQENLVRLQRELEPARQELFRRLNMTPGGTSVLVEMRRLIQCKLAVEPDYVGIDYDLTHLLTSWFNRGFLVSERIDWRTSALVLEKLIRYEAVHAIQGWSDLRRRLQADRRCYAFFHPALPDEPLIFIEVALTRAMSERIQPLLDIESPVADPASANCAIFYSITNCQQGLRGVSFGNMLIKQVADALGREFPRLKTFATLSPVPGFCRWLDGFAKGRPELADIVGLLTSPGWMQSQENTHQFQKRLVNLCAYYLLHAKRSDEPLDAVARFHLRNGARLERINWLGDISSKGIQRGAGLMVNYVYHLGDLEKNHEAYAQGGHIAASKQVSLLARESIVSA